MKLKPQINPEPLSVIALMNRVRRNQPISIKNSLLRVEMQFLTIFARKRIFRNFPLNFSRKLNRRPFFPRTSL